MRPPLPQATTPKTNLLKSIGRVLKRLPVVSVYTTGSGQMFATDGANALAIVAAPRAKGLRHGIARRIEGLARQYHLTDIPFQAGDLVVNCGANIGELALAAQARGCRVIAVEPDPVALRCLRLNLPDAEIIESGLWNTDGDLTFYMKADTADTSAIQSEEHGQLETLTIPVKKLDSIAAGIDGRIRLLVGDAEGGEPEVLEGALKTLPRIDFVSLNCGPERNGKRTIEPCSEILREAGFEIVHGGDFLLARNVDARKN